MPLLLLLTELLGVWQLFPGKKPQPQTAQDLPTTFALGALFYPMPRAGQRQRKRPEQQKEIQSKVQVNPA